MNQSKHGISYRAALMGRYAGVSRKIVSIAVTALALCVLPGTAISREHTILELYQLAKANDPAVRRAEARLDGSRADKDIAWAAMLPRVNANASLKEFWHKVLNYSSGNFEGNYTGYSYGVGGTQSIVNLPAYYQISAAKAGIDSAGYGIQQVRQEVIVRLLDGYIRYLKATADEKVLRDELSRVGKVLEQAEAFRKAGTGDIVAVYEAKARLDSAAADLVKVQGQRRLALQTLSSLTGITVEDVTDLDVERSAAPEPADLDWWIATMKQRNPSLLQARSDVTQAEAYRKTSYAGHYPSLQINGGYTSDKGSTFLPKVQTDQWYAGIGVTLSLYSGGEIAARTRRAMASESERLAILEETEVDAIRRLKEAYHNQVYTHRLAEAYTRKRDSAEQQLKAVQKGREVGIRTAIDLLNAEQGFAISLRDLTSARYDNALNRFQLKYAAGILTEDDLSTLNVTPAANRK